MYTTINGWTKARMIDAIMAGNKGTRARNETGPCMYLTDDGNKCAVGCFVPEDHTASHGFEGSVDRLLKCFPELAAAMPLDSDALYNMQLVHDQTANSCDPRPAIVDWINANVTDGSVP